MLPRPDGLGARRWCTRTNIPLYPRIRIHAAFGPVHRCGGHREHDGARDALDTRDTLERVVRTGLAQLDVNAMPVRRNAGQAEGLPSG